MSSAIWYSGITDAQRPETTALEQAVSGLLKPQWLLLHYSLPSLQAIRFQHIHPGSTSIWLLPFPGYPVTSWILLQLRFLLLGLLPS